VRQREQFVLAFNDLLVVAESEYVSCCSFTFMRLLCKLRMFFSLTRTFSMKHFSQNILVDNKLKTYIMFVIFKTSNKDFVLNSACVFFLDAQEWEKGGFCSCRMFSRTFWNFQLAKKCSHVIASCISLEATCFYSCLALLSVVLYCTFTRTFWRMF